MGFACRELPLNDMLLIEWVINKENVIYESKSEEAKQKEGVDVQCKGGG